MIQSTTTRIGRRHLAFAVANCVLNRRFAAVTVGSNGDCGKLRRIAGEAHNVTKNALSILIVLFFCTTPTNLDLRQKVVYFPVWVVHTILTRVVFFPSEIKIE